MEALLTERLLASHRITSLIGRTERARIYWDDLPQREALPAVILRKIFTGRNRTLRGRIGNTESRVQVDCWAGTRAEAIALREAVILTLDELVDPPLQAALNDDPPDFHEPATGPDAARRTALYRASLDVQLWHDPNAA